MAGPEQNRKMGKIQRLQKKFGLRGRGVTRSAFLPDLSPLVVLTTNTPNALLLSSFEDGSAAAVTLPQFRPFLVRPFLTSYSPPSLYSLQFSFLHSLSTLLSPLFLLYSTTPCPVNSTPPSHHAPVRTQPRSAESRGAGQCCPRAGVFGVVGGSGNGPSEKSALRRQETDHIGGHRVSRFAESFVSHLRDCMSVLTAQH